MNVSIISAISNVYTGFEGILQAKDESDRLYELAWEAGSGTLLGRENVELEIGGFYSGEIESEIIGSLRRNDEIRLKESFVRFIYSITGDEEKRRAYLHQLAVRTELFFRESYGMTKEIEEGYLDFYHCVKKRNSTKLVDILYKLLCLAISVRKEMIPAQTGQFFSNYIQDACSYVKENLGEENLSISTVAEQIFLNPVYFGRVFKQVMQMSFKQ